MPVGIGERRHSDSALEVEENGSQRPENLINIHTQGGDTSLSNGQEDEPRVHAEMIAARVESTQILSDSNVDFDTQVHTPEVFIFDYGVVVIWGMSLDQERRFLDEIQKYAVDKLEKEDREEECFNFYYTVEYQARIYNDFITLRDKGNYMTKLAISHALAQSVKVRSYPYPPYLVQIGVGDRFGDVFGNANDKRPPSSKQWSTPPSKKTNPSPKKSPKRAPSPTPAQKSTSKLASSSTSASTSTSTAPSSTPPSSSGSSPNSNPSTKPYGVIWRWIRGWDC